MTTEQIDSTVWELARRATEVGGTPLLDRVTAILEPVARHVGAIRIGALRLTDGLSEEIARDLGRASAEISAWAERNGAGIG